MIYLDNAASTPTKQKVLDEMLPYLKGNYGNPGSIHSIGRNAAKAVLNAREQVAKLIGAEPGQIIFTSGGTESNNLALLGTEKYLRSKNKTHVITAAAEHDSVLTPVKELEKRGFEVTVLPVNECGLVDPAILKDAIKCNTGLVSLMYVNNELGSMNDVKKLSTVCKEHRVLFHTDAVQAIHSIKGICVKDIGCDFMSISAQKIGGPKGVGALYAADRKLLEPLIYGGETQEFGLRGGTENVAGIVGFGKACELINIKDIACSVPLFIACLMCEMRDRGIEDVISYNGIRDFPGTSIVNLSFKGIDNETLILMLENQGVFVSAGSACNGHSSSPSHVLKAIGLSDDEARSSIRVSFSDQNVFNEISSASKIIAECVEILFGMNESGGKK